MTKLVTSQGAFRLIRFDSEKEFERAVVGQVPDIFGDRRVYLDCKRRIGGKVGKQSIPDAYLIDLSRAQEPRLYVVENEISSHDLFRHIGVQLLQFSVSFRQAERQIRQLLYEELAQSTAHQQICLEYAKSNGFRNLDHLLDEILFDKPFRALVIIDEETDDLHTVVKNLGFDVEVIEFNAYENEKNERIYRFAPFLEDVEFVPEARESDAIASPLSELDTVVVPAHEEGFQRVFIEENRWWSVRIHSTMAPQLKYIAVYRTSPTSAITHYAEIRSIEPWKDTNKVVINFVSPAKPIGPLRLVRGGRIKPLYGLRYTSFDRVKKAKNLDQAFALKN